MISIRRFTDKDMGLVEEFYCRSYEGDVQRRIDAFKWIHNFNPLADDENKYILMFDGWKIIGYWGVMPTKVYCFGQAFPVLFIQEGLIDPSYRGRGLSYKLVSEVKRSNRFIISMWHNERVMNIQKNVGWSQIGRYGPMKKIYDLEKIILFKFKYPYLAKLINSLSRRYLKRQSSHDGDAGDYELDFVRKCGLEYDKFFTDVAAKYAILSDRTAATLNWKYIDIPYKRYSFLEVRRTGTLSGYLVLRIDEQDVGIRKGIIADLLVDPDEPDVLACLLKKAEEIFVENKVDFSVCLVKPEMFRSVFKERGYYEAKSKRTDSLWICNEDKSLNRALVLDMNNWYITYGESDGDMW